MPRRPLIKDDYVKRRALYLPDEARYDSIMALPNEEELDQALIDAITAIEKAFEPLDGVLPKEFTIFERTVLEDLLRIFNREALRTAGGDVFGRIYEYFLMKFAIQGAQDNGEFLTPPALVQTIVNVIEPDHGTIFDPACGSAGMFVQSSHFIERLGQDTAHRVTFFGQEKTATTIRLAKMNLAVHGLEGDIREANTFYIAEKIKGLIKQVDLLYKLVSRATELAGDLASELPSPSTKGMQQGAISSSLPLEKGQGEGLNGYDRREITRLIKQLDTACWLKSGCWT
jgi:hypothetical protein